MQNLFEFNLKYTKYCLNVCLFSNFSGKIVNIRLICTNFAQYYA